MGANQCWCVLATRPTLVLDCATLPLQALLLWNDDDC